MRAVHEWTGKTHDTPVPPRVRVRVFEAKHGRCHRCGRKIAAGERWTCEHLVALVNGGSNSEDNLDVTCDWCLPAKNAEDVAEKAFVYKRRKSHLGIRPKSKFACSRDGKFKKRMDGTVVLRDAR